MHVPSRRGADTDLPGLSSQLVETEQVSSKCRARLLLKVLRQRMIKYITQHLSLAFASHTHQSCRQITSLHWSGRKELAQVIWQSALLTRYCTPGPERQNKKWQSLFGECTVTSRMWGSRSDAYLHTGRKGQIWKVKVMRPQNSLVWEKCLYRNIALTVMEEDHRVFFRLLFLFQYYQERNKSTA